MCRFLFVVVLVTISLQYAEANVNDYLKEPIKSLEFQREARGISDIWNNIKSSAKNAWNAVQNIAEKTKDKVKDWAGSVKEQAQTAKQKIEERIKEIREKSKSTLEQLLGSGLYVKECFQEENKELGKILKQITQYVTECIADYLNSLNSLDKLGFRFELNETLFVNGVKNKMNQCISNQEDVEECLYKVREKIYSFVESMENEVLTNRAEARGIIDDLLDNVINCSIKGLIDASNAIAAESIQIIKCVANKQT